MLPPCPLSPESLILGFGTRTANPTPDEVEAVESEEEEEAEEGEEEEVDSSVDLSNLEGEELQPRIDSAVSQAETKLGKQGFRRGLASRGSKAKIWNDLGGDVEGFAKQGAFEQDLGRHLQKGGERTRLTTRSLPVKKNLVAALERYVNTKKRKGVPRQDEQEQEQDDEAVCEPT